MTARREATLFRADGTTADVTPLPGRRMSLRDLQGMVGGMIEVVRFPDGRQLIVNEDGMFAEEPQRNDRATEEWRKAFPIGEFPKNNAAYYMGIVGDAVIATPGCI